MLDPVRRRVSEMLHVELFGGGRNCSETQRMCGQRCS
jgi:hypothetical protein